MNKSNVFHEEVNQTRENKSNTFHEIVKNLLKILQQEDLENLQNSIYTNIIIFILIFVYE